MHPDDCVITINGKDTKKKANCISINSDEIQFLPCTAATFPSSYNSSLNVDLCLTGAALMLSCTALVIAFPAYVAELKSSTAAYLLPVVVTSVLLAFCVAFSRCGTKPQPYYEHPGCIYSLMLIAMYFGFGYIMVFYSSFQNSLPCAFQSSVRIITVSISTFLYYISNKKGLSEMTSGFALVFGLIVSSDFGFSYFLICGERKDIHWLIHAFWIIINSLGYHLMTCAIHLTEEYVLRDPINKLYEEVRKLSNIQSTSEKSKPTKHIAIQAFTFASSVEQTIDDLKKSSLKIAFRLQGALCIMFSLFGCISVILAIINITPYNASFSSRLLDDGICHIPGVHNPQSVNFFYLNDPYIVSFIRYMRSSNEVKTVSNVLNVKKEVINISENEVLDIKIRGKRSSVQTNALGFKIIQPTDSILQGHVITTKLKPALVGHVILNKTNINLNGHQITFKQDLFIREHDPLPSKMHRIHRGRGDVRFANDLMNATENPIIQDKAMSKSSNDSTDKMRQKRDAGPNDSTFTITSDNKFENKENLVNDTFDVQEHSMQDVYFSDLFPIMDDGDDNLDKEEIQFLSIEEWQKVNGRLTNTGKNNNKPTKKKTIENVKKNMSRESVDSKNKTLKNSSTKEKIYKNILPGGPDKSKNVSVDGQKKLFESEIAQPRDCGNRAYYGWLVIVAYFTFSISFVRFLILSQASTITMLMMVPALLLSRVWWSVGRGSSDEVLNNYFAEIILPLITAFTGVPSIIIGVFFLIKLQLEKLSASIND